MPTYKVIFNDGWNGDVAECRSDKEATEWATEILLDDGGEPGDGAAVYKMHRNDWELVATVEVPE